MDDIKEDKRYLLVEDSVLPEVFLRVIEAKQLLARGKAKNLSEAATMVEISRSTFYKYKDSVFTYESAMVRQIATLSAELEDRSGVLSAFLSTLSGEGANILTINQNIPVDGVAPVSISMRTEHMAGGLDNVMRRLRGLDGVVNIRLLSN